MLVLEFRGVLELQTHDGSLFLLIGPVPQRNCLWLIVSESNKVIVISRDVDGLHTVRVRVEICADGCPRNGVPHNKHGIVTSIGSHNPALILRAGCRGNTVAVTLKKSLCLC